MQSDNLRSLQRSSCSKWRNGFHSKKSNEIIFTKPNQRGKIHTIYEQDSLHCTCLIVKRIIRAAERRQHEYPDYGFDAFSHHGPPL